MKIIRKLKRLNTIRKRRNRAKIAKARKIASAQAKITRDSRTTAGELRATGEFEWAGSGLPDNTLMEPRRAKGGGWEWVPVVRKPAAKRAVRTAYAPDTRSIKDKRPGEGNWAQAAQRCGAPTKDKTPCENTGDCHYHREWRKAHNR